MSKNRATLITMALQTASSLGGVVIAFVQKVPTVAVCISFASVMFNYILGTRAGLIQAPKWSN